MEGRAVPQSTEAVALVDHRLVKDTGETLSALPRDENHPRGIVLAVHGQNQAPKALDSALIWLNTQGFETFRVALVGHRNRPEELGEISRENFLKDILSAYEQAKQRSAQMNVALVGFGYSQGAALLVDFLGAAPNVEFSEFLFMAPAIASPFSGDIVRVVDHLFPSLRYPSAIPPKYRANAWFNLKASVALFESIDSIQEMPTEKLNIPTHIYMDKDDELVSQPGIEKFISDKGLSKWEIHSVSVDGTKLGRKIHHLIVDEDAVGSDEWNRMLSGWSDFLSKKN